MSKLTTPNPVYKPLSYPWAFEAWKKHEQMHWLPDEVPLAEDVKDWSTKLSKEEINLLTQIFRFFTQQDVVVGGAYVDQYLKVFHANEVRMMLTGFAARESIHQEAYANLLDTVGMPEVEYSAFFQYKEMKEKFEYSQQFNVDTPYDTAKCMAVFSAFMEGLQLFSSFAMLMNFPRFNKMKGMGQIVTWSIRDEAMHVEGMMMLFRTFITENKHLWTDKLKKEIYDIARQMVEHEDAFIDLAFEQGGVEGMTAEDIKLYIRYICDRRLTQLGLKPNYHIKDNPLPWLDIMVNAPEFTNFFEARATEYSRAATTGTWDDAFKIHDHSSYTIYGQAGCSQCVTAKAILDSKNIKYTYIDLTSNPDKKADLYTVYGIRSMPVIFKDGEFLGGIVDLQKVV